MRQPGGGVCRLRTPIACCTSPEEGNVEQSLSYQARRALLQQAVPQYREASPSQKRTLLDTFVAATGYHRTYARWLLNHADEVQPTLQRPRPAQYGQDVALPQQESDSALFEKRTLRRLLSRFQPAHSCPLSLAQKNR